MDMGDGLPKLAVPSISIGLISGVFSSCSAFPISGISTKVRLDLMSFMLRSLFSLVFAAVMWVQVPQWKADWSKCAVDVPDVSCHWYVVAPDNTFGEGFDWATAPWFDANGLQDVAQLENTMQGIHEDALASS